MWEGIQADSPNLDISMDLYIPIIAWTHDSSTNSRPFSCLDLALLYFRLQLAPVCPCPRSPDTFYPISVEGNNHENNRDWNRYSNYTCTLFIS